MLRKRKEHFDRVAKEIEALRAEQSDTAEPSLEPRRVDPSLFFSRIHQMQQKGGAGNVPLC